VDRALLAALAAEPPGVDPPNPFADLLRRPEWHAEAACRGQGVDLFFPANGGSAAPAKAICATCPALDPCREWALDQGPELAGIFGGTSAIDRAKIRKVTRSAEGAGCALPPSDGARST